MFPLPGPVVSWDPTARGFEAAFEAGRLAVAALAPGLVRVRFAPEGEFAPRRSWDVALPDEAFAPAPTEVEESPEGVVLAAGEIRVRLDRERGTLRFTDAEGREFASDLAAPRQSEARLGDLGFYAREGDELPPGRARRLVRVEKAMDPEEGYFGFGQRALALDRRGERMTNWNVDPKWGHHRGMDNLYQSHPVFMALRPGLAWGLFLHSTWWSRFDVGAARPGVLEIATLGGEMDYYVLHGPDPAGVVEKLTRLTGRPLLPPLWALGYHQSRWGYVTDREIEDLARTFRERDIPLDVVHLDIDYMRGYRCFTWDPDRFPDPAALLRSLRERQVRAVTIVDPGIKHEFGAGYDVAEDMALRGAFCKDSTGSPYIGYCWPDAAMFPDFLDPKAREWWGGLQGRLLEAGVSGIWQDMNEPAIFDRPFTSGLAGHRPMPLGLVHGPEEESATHAEVHNLYGLLMCRATREGLERLRPEERPWTLTRSAFTGVQALSATWMGDNTAWWEHLAMSLPQLASMGLCGVPHAGVDIGGFFGNCHPELYARWIQLGTFYPFMRTHSAWDTLRQEPWSFGPEVEAIAREAIRLRYRLLPYLYTLAWRAHRSGEPILRPMLFDFPDDREAMRRDDQVMFGPQMLVAPILHPGRRHRLVWLPEGSWYDFHTGRRHEGPAPLAVEAGLDRIPVFVRGGSILTLGRARGSTEESLEELALEVYPGTGGEWSWIEDDGLTRASQEGSPAETRARVAVDGTTVTLELLERQGSYQPPSRILRVRVHLPERPAGVLRDGRPADWRWEDGCATLTWEDDGREHRVTVRS